MIKIHSDLSVLPKGPVLLFDTETDGVTDKRLVQLGMVLVDPSDWRVLMEANLLVKPEGFKIPAEATAVHGISHEKAREHGMDLEDVLDLYGVFARRASLVVSHNVEFDLQVIGGEFQRLRSTAPVVPQFCTMQHMRAVAAVPGGRSGGKWTRLAHAYRHAFGEDFENAHDAMADVRATLRLFRWIREQAADDLSGNGVPRSREVAA